MAQGPKNEKGWWLVDTILYLANQSKPYSVQLRLTLLIYITITTIWHKSKHCSLMSNKRTQKLCSALFILSMNYFCKVLQRKTKTNSQISTRCSLLKDTDLWLRRTVLEFETSLSFYNFSDILGKRKKKDKNILFHWKTRIYTFCSERKFNCIFLPQ